MAYLQKGDHSLMFICLLILEFAFFSCGAVSKEIMLSKNFSCGSALSLSSQIDSYKIIFPQDATSSLCQCPGCNRKWTCRIRFEADEFILSSFEFCIDSTHQEIRNCDHAHIIYDIGYDNGVMTQFCSLTYPVKCLGRDKSVPIIFFERQPCSFTGFNLIFLQARHASTYVLFKENRPCRDNGHSLEADSGRVVSEFDHHIQKWPHFCLLHVSGKKGKEYSEFCFWPEFVSFGNMSALSITVSSVDGEFEWIFNRIHASEKRYCEPARPEGYIISAIVDADDSLNDHRFRLQYKFTEKVVWNEGSDSGNDDDDDGYDDEEDDDDILPVPFWLILAGATAFILIVGVVFKIWYKHRDDCRLIHQRQPESRHYPDRASAPLNRPTSSSFAATTTITNTSILVSPGDDDDHESRISSSVAPSAPMMEENGGPGAPPPAYPGSPDNPPPSYESLFHNTSA